MKKISIVVIVLLFLGSGTFLGYKAHTESAKNAKLEFENYYGTPRYTEMDKTGIRNYANNFLSSTVNNVNYNLYVYLMNKSSPTKHEFDMLADFIEENGDTTQRIRDFHSEGFVPIEMKAVHEEILRGLKEYSAASKLIDEAIEEDDPKEVDRRLYESLEEIDDHIGKMHDIIINAYKKNPSLKWNKREEKYDFLTNQ